MKNRDELKNIAIQVIRDEKKAISNLENLIGDSFADAVGTIFSAEGRVVVTGIGKSANIATKIVSTLNSTGTPALFLHAADAIHGDLGMVRPGDVVSLRGHGKAAVRDIGGQSRKGRTYVDGEVYI